jgi:hypothetical protein
VSDGPPDTTETPAFPGCIWRVLRVVLIVAYLFFSTLISVLGALAVPSVGPPISAHLPADSMLVLHLRNGNETWAALEEHPAVKVLWEDPEFQERTHLKEKWEERQQEWQKNALANWLMPLSRPGLAFALGGELAVAVEEKPPESPNDEDAPAVIFGRVQGARGGLLKAAIWIAGRKNQGQRERPRFLGGDLVALEIKGGAAAQPGAGLRRMSCPDDAAAFLHVRQGVLQMLPALWEWSGVTPPDRIQLYLSPAGEGGLRASGEWDGSRPEMIAPGPLPAPVLPEGARPLLDLTMPLNARTAFLHWVESAMAKGGKSESRWQMRMGRLAEAGVDLNRDLWPHLGQTLRFQVLPAPEDSATGYAVATASLPFRVEAADPQAPPRATLVQFGKAYADEFYEGTVPRDAERPYFVHVRGEDGSRMVWVKSTILRPTFYVHPQGFALLSDAGPMALTPLAPGLAPREEPWSGVFLRLKAEGTGLAPHIGMLTQMALEDRRDELGAAEFLNRFPDERVIVAFAKKLSCLLGHLEVEIATPAGTSEGQPAGIRVQWQPELK